MKKHEKIFNIEKENADRFALVWSTKPKRKKEWNSDCKRTTE